MNFCHKPSNHILPNPRVKRYPREQGSTEPARSCRQLDWTESSRHSHTQMGTHALKAEGGKTGQYQQEDYTQMTLLGNVLRDLDSWIICNQTKKDDTQQKTVYVQIFFFFFPFSNHRVKLGNNSLRASSIFQGNPVYAFKGKYITTCRYVLGKWSLRLCSGSSLQCFSKWGR